MLDQIFNFTLSYFLCQFSPKERLRKTRDVVRQFALEHFSETWVDEFLDLRLNKLQDALVEEFNDCYAKNKPIRFEFADGDGNLIKGNYQKTSEQLIKFQDTLNSISHTEFEKLSAIVLRLIGCESVFFTPESHDQGVDAFGYKTLLDPLPYGVVHDLIWIAQAKHYNSTKVATGDIRELVGSKELLVARVFSTVDERYKQLSLRAYAPTALILVTSEEIPSTVRRLAERGGLFVFSAFDLYELLKSSLKTPTKIQLERFIKMNEKTIAKLT